MRSIARWMNSSLQNKQGYRFVQKKVAGGDCAARRRGGLFMRVWGTRISLAHALFVSAATKAEDFG
jgi:hypothetical protein